MSSQESETFKYLGLYIDQKKMQLRPIDTIYKRIKGM